MRRQVYETPRGMQPMAASLFLLASTYNELLTPCNGRLLECLLAPYAVLGVLPSLHDGQHLFALEDLFL